MCILALAVLGGGGRWDGGRGDGEPAVSGVGVGGGA